MSDTNNNIHTISILLQSWYPQHKRDLPWRHTSDPYLIWVSEVILQQTRVEQGYDYFVRFVRKFPDIWALASASEEDVLKIWQGLGYYSRARNMLQAAKQLVNEFEGVFPSDFEKILSLKGVGNYTAAAIASFAFGKPHATVDGNVSRVISRLFEVQHPINSTEGKKQLQSVADQIIDPVHPGIHNQAMMELGATICLPRRPKCEECPLQTVCMAHHHHSVASFPSKIVKTKVRDRFFNYFHIMHENETFLRKRIEDDVWKNLYEFPLIETSGQVSLIEISDEEKFGKWFSKSHSLQFEHVVSMKHILSHQRIFAEFYRVKTEESIDHLPDLSFIKIDMADIEKYPVSRLIHKYLERFFC